MGAKTYGGSDLNRTNIHQKLKITNDGLPFIDEKVTEKKRD